MSDKITEIRARHERIQRDCTLATPPGSMAGQVAAVDAHDDRATLLAEVERLRDQIERLRAALKPFAAEAEAYDPPEGDDAETAWFSLFTCGNLRDARNALEGNL